MIVVRCSFCSENNNIDSILNEQDCCNCKKPLLIDYVTRSTQDQLDILKDRVRVLEGEIKDLRTEIGRMKSQIRDARMYTARIG